MKKLIVTSLLAGASFTAFSQTSISNYGCGTVATEAQLDEITAFFQNGGGLKKTTAGVDTIPLTIQIVGKNDGTGYYSLENLFTVICETNQRYAPVGVYFNIKWPIKYINNSTYYEHNNTTGSAMMAANNVPNTINLYFVGDPNGNCGYYSRGRDAIAIKNSCSEPKSTTLVHELGHFFTLPHTFSGWENGNTPSNPELVTRGAGANCSTAGDRFCDTEADFLSARWNCPYTGKQTDPTGTPYKPDGTMYMSYSDDACTNKFSPMQIAKMQDNISSSRTSMVANSNPADNIAMGKPNVIYPNNILYSNYKSIRWDKVPGAEYYYVKVIYNSVFVKKTAFTSDTFIELDFDMSNNNKYNVTIIPINGVNTCGTNAITMDYVYTSSTTSISSNEVVGNASMSLSPNPANNLVKVSLDALPTGSYNLSVVNVNGQKVYEQNMNYAGGKGSTTLDVSNFPAGLYIVRFNSEEAQLIQKMVVQH
jgi:hypothetical protein